MKKAKILLFWLVLSVLSVCSFSDAKSITFVFDWTSYSPNPYKFSSDSFKNLRVVDFSCGGWTINGSNWSTDSCFIEFSYWWQNCEIQNWWQYGFTKVYNYCVWKDFVWDVSVLRQWNSTPFSSITFEDWQFDIMQNWLTPVITWLTNSINEFIPYMVYIGLWVLGVIVWFFAIKRLLRYVNRSTFNVFSSRRKKK